MKLRTLLFGAIRDLEAVTESGRLIFHALITQLRNQCSSQFLFDNELMQTPVN